MAEPAAIAVVRCSGVMPGAFESGVSFVGTSADFYHGGRGEPRRFTEEDDIAVCAQRVQARRPIEKRPNRIVRRRLKTMGRTRAVNNRAQCDQYRIASPCIFMVLRAPGGKTLLPCLRSRANHTIEDPGR